MSLGTLQLSQRLHLINKANGLYQWLLALFEVLLNLFDYKINNLCFVMLSDMQSI